MEKKFKKYCNNLGIRFNLSIERMIKRDKEIFKDRFEQREIEENERAKFTDGENYHYVFLEKKIFNDQVYMSDKIYGYPIKFDETIASIHPDPFLVSSLEVIRQIEILKPKKVLDLGCYNAILLSFLAQEYPEIKFFGIDREKQILSFTQDKFNLPNLSLIGADFEDTKIIKSNDCDFIYSCFGFQVEGAPSIYNNPIIRKNDIYEYNKREFKKIFAFANTQSSLNAIFIPIIRIGHFDTYVAFTDAASEEGWALNVDKTKRIKFFDKAYNSQESIPISFFHKDKNHLIDLSILFEVSEKKLFFNLDYDFEKYKFENLGKEKKLLDKKNIVSPEGYKIYLELGHANAAENSFYCFISYEHGAAAFKESSSFDEIQSWLKDYGFGS
jgi:SAM-dependent methyltransferase